VGAITARKYADGLVPRRTKNPQSPNFAAGSFRADEAVHKGGFRQPANNQTNRWLGAFLQKMYQYFPKTLAISGFFLSQENAAFFIRML
jgi:hypothetical protein